jgi:hypothetical protein
LLVWFVASVNHSGFDQRHQGLVQAVPESVVGPEHVLRIRWKGLALE